MGSFSERPAPLCYRDLPLEEGAGPARIRGLDDNRAARRGDGGHLDGTMQGDLRPAWSGP